MNVITGLNTEFLVIDSKLKSLLASVRCDIRLCSLTGMYHWPWSMQCGLTHLHYNGSHSIVIHWLNKEIWLMSN